MPQAEKVFKGFCYFIPGGSRGAPDVAALKIPCLAPENGNIMTRGVPQAGPSGVAGGVLAWIEQPGVPLWRWAPEAQVWTRIAPEGSGAACEYWIGHAKDAPPLPEDLMRPSPLQGVNVKVGEYIWHVPVLRSFPAVYQVASSGQLEKTINPAYADLLRDGTIYLEARLGLDYAIELATDAFVFDLAARILGLNYRVGKFELALMGGVDTRALIEILDGAVDFLVQYEDVKKKLEAARAAGLLASGSGGSTETPDTPPA